MNDDVFFAAIPELNARLKKREFSAFELARAFSERLNTLGPKYHALALSLTESALKQARQVDDEFHIERLRGPLQGIPFGAKDLLSVAGAVTTWGAKPYEDQVFDETATVLKKLAKTGSVLIGKLAMVELAGGGGYRTAAASLFGPGLNPWDTTRWSGGSSSGSASSVAAGLVPFALGSETSGSILTPAAYCGVTGLRPTYGLVSRSGAMSLSWTMDKIGSICRSAEDCGIVLQAIAGGDPKDPGSAGKSFYYTRQNSRNLKDLAIGYSPDDLEWVEPPVAPALQAAMAEIGATGVKLIEIKLPELPYGSLADIIIGSEGGAFFEPLITSGRVDQLADPSQAASLRANLTIPAKDYLRAMRIRSVVVRQFHELFTTVDALLAPTRYEIAPKILDPLDGPDPAGSGRATSPGMKSLIPAANLAGIPGLSVPCGFAETMPVALQIVGPPYSENTLLAIGRAFQDRTDWHRRRPPLLS